MAESADLLTAVATAVAALDGWTQSRWAPALFGRDPDHRQHHTFAVALPEFVPLQDRQVVAQGMPGGSVVNLLWSHRLKGDDQVGSYKDALNVEHLLVGAVLAIAPQHITLERAARRDVPEGWVLGTIQFRALHRYALTAPSP